jgi:2-keto-4-pentenoate hydratase/2-oxohepta-3-ene-1,7-dioic acid hydratase in catechol pathway
MHIARFADATGRVRIGRVHDDEVVVLDVEDGPTGVLAALDGTAAQVATATLADVRLLTPIPQPRKFFGLSLNYKSHNKEVGQPDPSYPSFFNKQTSCLVGPGDDIVIPAVSSMVDYEGELGVVIGTRTRSATTADAVDAVAGYVVVNDVSVRDWQLRSATTTLGKSFDTHGPVGPWLVTPDEIGDPADLRIQTWVNDELRQDARTNDMLFSIAEQLAEVSTACTLEPGDIIATGTPAGVGAMLAPPRWLTPGDRVRIEIERIGTLENSVVGTADATAS